MHTLMAATNDGYKVPVKPNIVVILRFPYRPCKILMDELRTL